MPTRRTSTMADREVMAMLLSNNVQFVVEVLREDVQSEGQAMRAIAATRSLDRVVDDTLRTLVTRAREAGHTWAEIGEVLHVTRQGAYQRFGANPATASATHEPLPGAAKLARRILHDFLAGRLQKVWERFDERMVDALSVDVLAEVRERVRAGGGEVVELGKPVVSVRDGVTVVEIPVVLERAQGTGQVVFDTEGRVAGFFVRPTSPAR